jgi:hypothetical protein
VALWGSICYGRGHMRGHGGRVLLILVAAGMWTSGCVSLREVAGYPAASEPSVARQRAAQSWVLIKNPRFGSVASEPEYIWVEEEKMPTTWRTLLLGKKSIVAPPEVVARYGSPPGGGRVSALHGAPYVVASEPAAPRGAPAAVEPKANARAATTGAAAAARQGVVVFVDTTRVVVDLTARDGVQAGTVLSLRRDKIPIVHPVTGELLGELDEEVATARVVEVREKFSVAEIQTLAPGSQIKVKDRVVPR